MRRVAVAPFSAKYWISNGHPVVRKCIDGAGAAVRRRFALALALGLTGMHPAIASPELSGARSAQGIVRHYAESAGPVEPADTITFVERKGRVGYTDSRNFYPLEISASRVIKVDANSSQYVVGYECDFCCADSNPRTVVVARQAVTARRLNTQAFSLYRQGKFLEAAAQFAMALKLDASLEMARTNFASALVRAGHTDEAAAVLFDDDGTLPLGRRLTLCTDTDLQLLASHPRIRAQNAAQPGTAVVTLNKGVLKGFDIAISKSRGLVAILSTHQSWGSAQTAVYLEIFSQKDGTRRLRAPLVSMDESDPESGRIAETATTKLREATAFLQALGFRTLAPGEFLRGRPTATGPSTASHFPTLGVSVTYDNAWVRVFRRGKLVGRSAQALGYFEDVFYVPDSHVFVVRSHHDEPEGCYAEYDIAVGAVVPIDPAGAEIRRH